MESRCPEPLRMSLGRILGGAAAIQRMAEDLLVLSRPVKPRVRVLSVATLIADALRSLDGRASSRVRRETRVSPDLNPVRADPDLVAQILGNLIRNAVEAMGDEGILTVHAVAGHGRRIRILVRDTGPGLDPEEAGRIFEPFHSTKPGGTGLGLPTARRLAEAMGGRLDVVSAPAKGAVFVLELPAAGGEAV
jgi:two-component system sensor histidine kinase HydH